MRVWRRSWGQIRRLGCARAKTGRDFHVFLEASQIVRGAGVSRGVVSRENAACSRTSAPSPFPSLLPPPLAEDLGIICLQGGKKIDWTRRRFQAMTSKRKQAAVQKQHSLPSTLWLAARPSPTRDLSLFIICNTLSRSTSEGVFSVPKRPSAWPSFCFLVFENFRKF